MLTKWIKEDILTCIRKYIIGAYMSFTYNFSVVRGIQAGREYYIAMIPLGLLSKLFQDEEGYISPEHRAQRCINEVRIPEIRDYILRNRNNYVFSALSASIDGDFTFIPAEIDSSVGLLKVDMGARFLINDGQHRKAAIEAAIKEAPELAKETISIVFFKDDGLKRSQQMFADLNKHAVKSTTSLSSLYDDRDDLNNAVKEVVRTNLFLNRYIDKERDNLGKNSLKLFTLANFVRANRRIVKSGECSKETAEFLKSYWMAIFTYIEEWKMLENKEIHKCDLREDYILTLSVTMQAWGRLGRWFYENDRSMQAIKGLKNIDWLRSNPEWQGRVLDVSGRVISNEDAIIKICAYIKAQLGIKLTKEEELKEHVARRY